MLLLSRPLYFGGLGGLPATIVATLAEVAWPARAGLVMLFAILKGRLPATVLRTTDVILYFILEKKELVIVAELCAACTLGVSVELDGCLSDTAPRNYASFYGASRTNEASVMQPLSSVPALPRNSACCPTCSLQSSPGVGQSSTEPSRILLNDLTLPLASV